MLWENSEKRKDRTKQVDGRMKGQRRPNSEVEVEMGGGGGGL